MNPRRFALVAGILMIALAVLSFIPSLNWNNDALIPLKLDSSHGHFLGIVPLNVLNKIALIVFGVAGIAASSWKDRAVPASINYSRVLFYVMGALAILGMIPDTRTLFGYAPLYNGHIGVSALLAVLGAYFGYRLPIAAHDRLVERHLDPKHA
jgi:hypothetical protein